MLDAIFQLDWKSVGKNRHKTLPSPLVLPRFPRPFSVNTDFRTGTYFHHPDKYRYTYRGTNRRSRRYRGVDMHSVFNLLVISLNKHTARRRTDSLKLFCTHSHAIKKLHFSSPVCNPPPPSTGVRPTTTDRPYYCNGKIIPDRDAPWAKFPLHPFVRKQSRVMESWRGASVSTVNGV